MGYCSLTVQDAAAAQTDMLRKGILQIAADKGLAGHTAYQQGKPTGLITRLFTLPQECHTPDEVRRRIDVMAREYTDAFYNGDPKATPSPMARPCPFCGGAAFAPAHCPNCGAPKAGH